MTHGDAVLAGMQRAWVRVGMPAATKHLSRLAADSLYFLYTLGGYVCMWLRCIWLCSTPGGDVWASESVPNPKPQILNPKP
jgi:hypothetical protein